MSTISKVFWAEVAHKAMGNAPEDTDLAIGFGTDPLPSSEAEVIVRRARSGPHGRHARMPGARASQGPRVRGWGEHATVYRDVQASATPQHPSLAQHGSREKHSRMRTSIILIRSHYSRTARSRKAAEGRERVFYEKSFESHRARIPGVGKGLQ